FKIMHKKQYQSQLIINRKNFQTFQFYESTDSSDSSD
ncbi:unnamed protein product, partial [Rotaria sp. Silwood1]